MNIHTRGTGEGTGVGGSADENCRVQANGERKESFIYFVFVLYASRREKGRGARESSYTGSAGSDRQTDLLVDWSPHPGRRFTVDHDLRQWCAKTHTQRCGFV